MLASEEEQEEGGGGGEGGGLYKRHMLIYTDLCTMGRVSNYGWAEEEKAYNTYRFIFEVN